MKLVSLEQGSEAWLEFRKTRRNASESSVVLGINPYQKAAQLARIKRGEAKQFINSAMSRGTQYEAEARSWYECEIGLIGDGAVVEIEPYAASLDWWHQEKKIVTDFKVPASESSDLWQAALRGECPEHYEVQLQHQAAIVDADELYLAVYMPELADGRIIKVERSPKRWAEIQKAWDVFWETYMIPASMPDEERNDSDWFEVAERYRVAKMELDRAQAKMDEAKKELIDLAGDISAKGCGVQLIRSEREGSVSWSKLAKEMTIAPELIQKYTGKPSVVWSVKVD